MSREEIAPDAAQIARLAEAIAQRQREVTEAERRLTEAERQLAGRQEALADEQNDAALGAEGAAERAAGLTREVAAAEEHAKQCRAGLQTAQARHRSAVVNHREAEAHARRAAVPGLTSKYLQLSKRIEQLAGELGRTMNDYANAGIALGSAIDNSEARRVLGVNASVERVQGCLVNYFTWTDPNAERLAAFRGKALPLRWFPYDYYQHGQLHRTKLSAATQSALDAVVAIYATKAEAMAARARLDPSGKGLHVILPNMAEKLFHLVSGRLRGLAARRDQAEGAP